MAVEVDRKLVRWGSGFGIRLTADEVARLGVGAGATVHAEVAAVPATHNDFSNVEFFHFKQPYDVKKILEESFGGRR